MTYNKSSKESSNNNVLPYKKTSIAVWLIENTSLTFVQIAEFTSLTLFEIEAIADGDVATNIYGEDPIYNNILTREEIDRCQKDKNSKLQINQEFIDTYYLSKNSSKRKFTPSSKRNDMPNVILYMLKYYPNASSLEIKKLLGATKNIITSVKDKTHWNYSNLNPKHPVTLGICTQSRFNEFEELYKKNNIN